MKKIFFVLFSLFLIYTSIVETNSNIKIKEAKKELLEEIKKENIERSILNYKNSKNKEEKKIYEAFIWEKRCINYKKKYFLNINCPSYWKNKKEKDYKFLEKFASYNLEKTKKEYNIK